MLCNNYHLVFRYPITTKISRLRETKIEFPAVTVCNINVYNKTYIGGGRLPPKQAEAIVRASVGEVDAINW